MIVSRLWAVSGYRGAWLLIMGTFWLLFGIGVLFVDPVMTRPWVLYDYLPDAVDALGWWVSGGVAIWVALTKRSADDSLGHAALYLMPALRVGSFGVSAVVYLGTSVAHIYWPSVEVTGWPQAWYAALVWALVSVALALGSAWPNPVPPLVEPPAGGASE